VRSGAYGRAIRTALPAAAVFERPAPALVPLVERGAAQSQEAQDAVRAVVATLPGDLDALVYGCTHYPLLDAWFATALPASTERVDPALAQAAAAIRLVASAGIAPGDGTTRFYTNGDPVAFEREVRRWSGDANATVGALIAR
jgi:glutamate racemase